MKTAVCLIVKNEAGDLAEWIAYHLSTGFDTAIVYDNGSTDGTFAVAEQTARTMDVRVNHWIRSDIRSQMEAYDHACLSWGSEFDWIGFFDIDEFLVLHRELSLHQFLDRPADVGAIGVNWAIFGSNGHDEMPKRLIIEAFTRRSEAGMFANRHIKCLVRPSHYRSCLNPHYFDIEGRYVDAGGRDMEWFYDAPRCDYVHGLAAEEPDYHICQLNHYFTRSRAHWRRKVARGYPADVAIRKLEEFAEYDCNDVYDDSALWVAATVRRQLAGLEILS